MQLVKNSARCMSWLLGWPYFRGDLCILWDRAGCPSDAATLVLTSAISVIVTALLATVIFVLVQIALCKCYPKFTPGGAETGTSAGGEGQEYEEVDGGGGTYMEVGGGGGGGGNTFQLKKNEAYASRTGHN